MDISNSGLQTTNKRLYFIAEDTRDRMEIQFVPQTLSSNRDVDLGVMKIVGRNTPRYQVVGGEKLLSFVLDFFADEQSRQSVMARTEWLEALTFTDGGKKPAQRVILVFGELYKKQKWTVKSIKTEMGLFSPQHGYLPQQASVQVTLCLDADYNLRWEDIAPFRSFGLSDGSNPVNLGLALKDDEASSKYLNATNENNFNSILKRAAERLRVFF